MSVIFSSDDADFAAYYAESEPAAKVHSASSWADQLTALSDSPVSITGARLPWSRTHDHIRYRPGEVSLWAGINGSGKSQLLGQVVLGFTAQKEKTCIASFEMLPIRTLERMRRQASMCEMPAKGFTQRFMRFLDDRLWIYDQHGQVDPKMVYAVIRYCARVLHIQHMVIDSLMKCVRGEDDYNGQKDFVNTLTTLARDENIHIHLVHHIRKSDNEDKPPSKWDVKGSGSIVDQVDQLMIVWRNKAKERAVAAAAAAEKQLDDESLKKPDAMICVEKNRNGEWEGRIPLWYHQQSLQYTGDSRAMPLNFIQGPQ